MLLGYPDDAIGKIDKAYLIASATSLLSACA